MKRYAFEQFTAVRMHHSAAYSHDGTQIAFIANTSGQHNLWVVPSGGGMARQLTAFQDNAVRSLEWSHDDSRIAFIADVDGNEQHQVYVIDAAGGWPKMLTNKLDAQYNLAGWSPDDSKLLFSGNDREPSNVDPIEYDMETGELRRLLTGAIYYAAGYSNDGAYVNVIQVYGNTHQDVWIVETESGEAALATPHEGGAIHYPAGWKKDNSGFFMVTNEGREFSNLAFYDLKTGKWDWFFTPDHDVDSVDISGDGKTMIVRINNGGSSELHGWNLTTGDKLDLPDFPVGVVLTSDINHDGSKLAICFSSAKESANIYEFDLQTGAMTALSQSMLGGIDLDDMVDPELIHYPTFDGKQIPAWLYKPQNAVDNVPVLLSIHGGPESQERPQYNYSGLYQYLLNRGIAILAPNIRGSTGFGISYQQLIHRDWGGDELKDIEHAAKYLQSLDWVDNDKIGVFGGSFGGFATLSAVTRLPDYWAVGVDIVGPSNLITFLESVPPHWKPMMKTWLGDTVEDRDFLIERSPITYAANIKAPLLVIQGANDPRVVKAESDQMVEIMRENGSEVTYYVDPEEGHGATRTKNRNKWMQMIAEYVERHLTPEAIAQPAGD